jgi:hypothetical protein
VTVDVPHREKEITMTQPNPIGEGGAPNPGTAADKPAGHR